MDYACKTTRADPNAGPPTRATLGGMMKPVTQFSDRPGAPRTLRRSATLRAFTIVEVAVAAVVLAFGISSAIVTIQAGYRTMTTPAT